MKLRAIHRLSKKLLLYTLRIMDYPKNVPTVERLEKQIRCKKAAISNYKKELESLCTQLEFQQKPPGHYHYRHDSREVMLHSLLMDRILRARSRMAKEKERLRATRELLIDLKEVE